MIRFTILLVWVASEAHALPMPLPEGPPGLECTYEGVFPGSSVKSTWTIRARSNGRYVLELSDPDILLGVITHRLGSQPESIRSVTLEGATSHQGKLTTDRYQLKVLVKNSNGSSMLVTNTVVEESRCKDRPADVQVGAKWHCIESLQDDWSWEGASKQRDSGSQKGSMQVAYRYDRNETMTIAALGEFESAVIVRREEGGRTIKQWLDVAQPSCPVRIERLYADRVVGVDRLLSRKVVEVVVGSNGSDSIDSGTKSKPAPIEGHSQWWLIGIACIGLIGGLWLGNRMRDPSP